MLQQLHQEQTPNTEETLFSQTLHQENDGCIEQREIDEDDVCPICQEELLKKMLPITYCRCTECIEYHLCHDCFTSFCHSPHVFVFRQKRNKKWRALRQLSELSAQGGTRNPRSNSKEEILYLQGKTSCTPKNIVKSLPIILISKRSNLLAPGIQCRLCLKSFQLCQHVRLLPCNHKFHRECIDSWLLQQRNTCPIDEYVVYNPLTWKNTPAKHENYPTSSHANISNLGKEMEPEICVSGNGFFLKQTSSKQASEISQRSFRKLANKDVPKSQKDLRFFSNLHLGESNQNSSRNLSDFSKHSKDYTLSYFETTFSGKSSTFRKDDIHTASRSQQQLDCGNTNKVVTSKKDGGNNSTILRHRREMNFEINLCAASHSSKKDNKDVGNASHQRRLLARLPYKYNHLNFKTGKTDFLLEGIPLHTSS